MTTKLQPKKISTHGYDSPFSSVLFQRDPEPGIDYGADTFCYGPNYHRDSLTSWYHRVTTLSGIVDNAEDKWFIFYVADCYSPPMYAVSASCFEDAYASFITECEHLVKIDEADLKDYNIGEGDEGKLDCDFNDNGTPVDTESVHGFEVKLVEARR